MTLKEFERLAKFAKKLGLVHVKMGTTEFNFTPEALEKKIRISKKSSEKETTENALTDEQLLFYSTQDPRTLDG